MAAWRSASQPLRAVPRQASPTSDNIELTAAERAAFAGLVRGLADPGR
ncbi:hypothetical protein [Streptomyces tsukubensis]|nr:hypothetical protein [Streptomyces tsukubensis]